MIRHFMLGGKWTSWELSFCQLALLSSGMHLFRKDVFSVKDVCRNVVIINRLFMKKLNDAAAKAERINEFENYGLPKHLQSKYSNSQSIQYYWNGVSRSTLAFH